MSLIAFYAEVSDIAAHDRAESPGIRRPFFSIRSMLSTAIALVVAICLATVATGGSYALWNKSQAAGPPVTITSGSAALVVTTALAMPTTPMYPGLTLYGSAALQNTGTLPLSLRTTGLTIPTSNAFSTALTIGLATASTAARCANGDVSSTWTYGTFASPSVATIATPLAVGSTAVLCVSIQLSAQADTTSQNSSASGFSIMVDGIQN